jgi:hypothetical protein
VLERMKPRCSHHRLYRYQRWDWTCRSPCACLACGPVWRRVGFLIGWLLAAVSRAQTWPRATASAEIRGLAAQKQRKCSLKLCAKVTPWFSMASTRRKEIDGQSFARLWRWRCAHWPARYPPFHVCSTRACPHTVLGQVALVTGSTSGIGLGIASALAKQGATVLNGYGSKEEIACVIMLCRAAQCASPDACCCRALTKSLRDAHQVNVTHVHAGFASMFLFAGRGSLACVSAFRPHPGHLGCHTCWRSGCVCAEERRHSHQQRGHAVHLTHCGLSPGGAPNCTPVCQYTFAPAHCHMMLYACRSGSSSLRSISRRRSF